MDIDASDSGWDHPHRAEHGLAPVHTGRRREGAVALLVGELTQQAACRVGGGDDLLPCLFLPDGLDQRVPHHQEVRHRLGSLPGLGDDVDQRLAEVDRVKRRGDLLRVWVVEDEDARAAPFAVRQHVPVGVGERLDRGDRAERGASDADQYEVLIRVPHLAGKGDDSVGERGVVRKVHPFLLASIVFRLQTVVVLADLAADVVEVGLADPVLFADDTAHRILVVDNQA